MYKYLIELFLLLWGYIPSSEISGPYSDSGFNFGKDGDLGILTELCHYLTCLLMAHSYFQSKQFVYSLRENESEVLHW